MSSDTPLPDANVPTRTGYVTLLEGPDELWVADLTYIRLTTGFVFLAVVLDAWSRRVIGYAISHLLDVPTRANPRS